MTNLNCNALHDAADLIHQAADLLFDDGEIELSMLYRNIADDAIDMANERMKDIADQIAIERVPVCVGVWKGGC